jgi:hypothetical protein
MSIVGWGCGDATEPSPSLAGPAGQAQRDGVTVTFVLERSRLVAGSRARALVTVQNTTSADRLWQGGGCNDLASVWIDTAAEVTPPKGRPWPGTAGSFKNLLLSGQPGPSRQGSFVDVRFLDPTRIACPADLGINTLRPGQHLEMRLVWSGDVNGVPAPAGPATVHASFPYLGQGPVADPTDVSRRIAVDLAVDVDPAPAPMMSPGEAIDAALADARFGAWVKAAGAMQMWDGVDMEAPDGAYVVILMVGGQSGRATVDRRTGAVAFESRPRQ